MADLSPCATRASADPERAELGDLNGLIQSGQPGQSRLVTARVARRALPLIMVLSGVRRLLDKARRSGCPYLGQSGGAAAGSSAHPGAGWVLRPTRAPYWPAAGERIAPAHGGPLLEGGAGDRDGASLRARGPMICRHAFAVGVRPPGACGTPG